MKPYSLTIFLPDEASTLCSGSRLAQYMQSKNGIVFLEGPLGAGKTTFSRGFLRGLGYQGAVKSPTYTLVEPYDVDGQQVFHFDFYRINDPQELEYMGIRDYFTDTAICLIEWPNKAEEVIPSADIHCNLKLCEEGREITFNAITPHGKTILQKIE